jgi:hypothetical protein
MVTAEDPFSHTYGGSSEFDVATFSTTFDKKSFGRRIVAMINSNINEPTISADRSWAYLNFWQHAQTPVILGHGRISDSDHTTDIQTRTPKWQSGKEVDRTRDEHQKRKWRRNGDHRCIC